MRRPSPLLLLPLLLVSLSHCAAFQCSTSPYSTLVPEFTVCPSDSWLDNRHPDLTNVNNDCDYSSTLAIGPCDSPDLLSPTPFCWRLLDSTIGMVEVVFPLLPQRCNFTGYDITLMVHEAAECPTFGDDFKKHSKKEVAIKDCTDASCMDQCRTNGSVVFRHVFTGCYQLFLMPHRHYQALQELVSGLVMLATGYNKTLVSTMQDPLLHLNWQPESLSMQAQFPMTPASSHITLSHGINTSEGRHACRNTGVPLSTCATCLGSSEILCKSSNSNSVVAACSYQGESTVRCSFSGLKPGNYCLRIQFDDERCVADTVWDDVNNYSPCTWELFQQFLPSDRPMVYEITPMASTVSPVLLVLLFIAVVVTCVVTGFIVYRRMLPNYPQFLPVRPKTMQIVKRPTVLLLYARDCPPFMQAVSELRTLMRRSYNCQVMDCWDENQYDSVAQSPARWLLSLLSHSRVRIVLVTSPASVVQEASLIHTTSVQYCQPRDFDCVLTHALTALHESRGQDSYNRLFVVRLDVGIDGGFPNVRTYLNPLTTYVLPLHLNKLMATLHNLDSAVCTITADISPETTALSDAIYQYRKYLQENPQYLDGLLVSENGGAVHHILT